MVYMGLVRESTVPNIRGCLLLVCTQAYVSISIFRQLFYIFVQCFWVFYFCVESYRFSGYLLYVFLVFKSSCDGAPKNLSLEIYFL